MLRNVKWMWANIPKSMSQGLIINLHPVPCFVNPVHYIHTNNACYKNANPLYLPVDKNKTGSPNYQKDFSVYHTEDTERQLLPTGSLSIMKLTKITTPDGKVYEQKEMKAMHLYPGYNTYNSQSYPNADHLSKQYSARQLAVIPNPANQTRTNDLSENLFVFLVKNNFIPGYRPQWEGCPQPQRYQQQPVNLTTNSQQQIRPPFCGNVARTGGFAPRNVDRQINHSNVMDGRQNYCPPMHLPYVHQGPQWERPQTMQKDQTYEHPLRNGCPRWCP